MRGVISKLCNLLIWNKDGKAISIQNVAINILDVRYSDDSTRVYIELVTDSPVVLKDKPEKLD